MTIRRRLGLLTAALVLPVGVIAAATPAQATTSCAKTYYVSPTGSDAANGTSTSTPWATTAKVNAQVIAPGTCVLFQGGKTFNGGLTLDASDAGSDANRVVLGSYGTGRATISSGSSNGIYLANTAGVTIQDLIVVGNGYDSNTASGINLYNTLPNATQLTGITITDVDASYYGASGIVFGGAPSDGSKSGYTKVSVTNSVVHDNADAGLQSYGTFSTNSTTYSNHDVTVDGVSAYNNRGIPGKGTNSGNGIVLGDVDRAVIQHSVAHDNGARNDYAGGGPVGIWTYDSNAVTIQFNESYHNLSSTPVDGDGYDLDGGVTNSFVQYNYSHDNLGAGVLVFQYDGARPLKNNVVRYNLSQNDSRGTDDAGIVVGGFGTGALNTDVYGNSIFVTPATTSGKTSAGVRVWGGAQNARFFNNAVVTTGSTPLVSVERNTTTTFAGNDWFNRSGTSRFLVGGQNFSDATATTYTSLAAWRNATGAERLNGKATGQTVDPKWSADPATSTSVNAFVLRSSSPLIGTGIDLWSVGISAGGRDYFGKPVPTPGKGYSVGASQG